MGSQASGANVAVKWRSGRGALGDPVARESVGVRRHRQAHLDHVVDVALGVGAARDRETHQLHRRRLFAPVGVQAEHDRPDLAAADAADFVERDRQGLPRVRERVDVGEEPSGVEIDGMTADRLHDRHAAIGERVAEVGGRPDPVAEVVVLDRLAQPLGERVEVTTREAAVGREAFGQHEQGAALVGERVVVHRQPAADVAQRVLLGAHRHAVCERRDLAHDVAYLTVAVAGLTLVDEPGVLGEPARIEEQRHPVLVAQRAHAAQVLE